MCVPKVASIHFFSFLQNCFAPRIFIVENPVRSLSKAKKWGAGLESVQDMAGRLWRFGIALAREKSAATLCF